MPKANVKTETAAQVEDTSSEDTSSAVVVDDADDDQGEGAELDALFKTAVEGTDLEEGGEDDSGKDDTVDESTTVEGEGEAAVEAGTDEESTETTAVEEPEVTPTVEEPTTEEPAALQPTTEPLVDPAKVQADYEKWRGDTEDVLAKHHYALSEEQAEEFDTSPGTAFPRLAAKLHMEVMTQSVAMIAGLLPRIMANVSKAQVTESQREAAFFKEWPELVKHRDQVVRHGGVYYQLNPQATFEEFMRDVGAQVAVSQKVDLSSRQTAVEEAPKVKAHKPLSAGGGPGVTTPGKKLGTFEQLDEDVEAYERG